MRKSKLLGSTTDRAIGGNEFRAIRILAPHLWPRGSLEVRCRVVLALVLLVGAKLTNV